MKTIIPTCSFDVSCQWLNIDIPLRNCWMLDSSDQCGDRSEIETRAFEKHTPDKARRWKNKRNQDQRLDIELVQASTRNDTFSMCLVGDRTHIRWCIHMASAEELKRRIFLVCYPTWDIPFGSSVVAHVIGDLKNRFDAMSSDPVQKHFIKRNSFITGN